MSKKSTVNSIEDAVLWQRVTSQVKPLKSTTQTVEFENLFAGINRPQNKFSDKIAKYQEKKVSTHGVLRPNVNFNRAEISKNVSPVDLRHGEKAGIDGSTKRRLSRGNVPVDSRLDLHGLTAARAKNELTLFIESSAYLGFRCVLVITGKGSGVLKEHVPKWLKRPPLSSYVLALADALPKDGGGGACYVLLRRKRGDK